MISRHVSDEEIQELAAGTSSESEKSRNNEEPKRVSYQVMEELDTSSSAETEDKYQWMFLCHWNLSTENKRYFITL